ncbi:FAD-dependent oxidoreductase [uncultured Agrococcus sp.]|uniref:FAD-dependent oxidoreductase n=1 Tax=uncultured Agrococcus sp. TaxID=382258 RepID=UPI0025E5FE31|nr:FAD-dependent oxidoreductase [uncultured Agrococcus sp.]
MRETDVLVIGAGQAGLSVAYHLVRKGFVPQPRAAEHRSFLMLDAEPGPGGAWRNRWESLTMASVNGIHDLPGMPQEVVDQSLPSRTVLPEYFARFEQRFDLDVQRPMRVQKVHFEEPDDQRGMLLAETETGAIRFRALVNATGTWRQPFVPFVPGMRDFRGQHLRTVDYVAAERFAGRHVAVVGGGISAVGFLAELSEVTTTSWFTRREPEFVDGDFRREQLTLAVERVDERVRQGLAPKSVVAVTGLRWTPTLLAAKRRGAMDRQPMFTRVEPDGVRLQDGGFQPADVIIWATGFRADIEHLAPLGLRGPGGGIVMDPPTVAGEPRVHLVGYGPSASTVGANRAGRVAVRRLAEYLDS